MKRLLWITVLLLFATACGLPNEAPGSEGQAYATGADSVQETQETQEPCPRSQGYWRNHRPWLADGEICDLAWSEVLITPPRGNAFFILGRQWVAARLNEAAGTDVSQVADALSAAHQLLTSPDVCEDRRIPHGPQRTMAIALAEELDEYNNSDACGSSRSLEMVHIPSSSFCMGSPGGGGSSECPDGPAELGRFLNEGPLHLVTLTRSFEMQVYPITRAQWEEHMGTSPTTSACGDCPMASVNWWDALAFANALSDYESLPRCFELVDCSGEQAVDFTCQEAIITSSTGSIYDCDGYRLPTEAEWEYANRATTSTAYYSGTNEAELCEFDTNLDEIAWYCGNSIELMPVGLKAPNSFGLFDMSGNVFAWTMDWFSASYYQLSPGIDPEGVETSTTKVIRGGSWSSFARNARAADRVFVPPSQRSESVGFRLVRTTD